MTSQKNYVSQRFNENRFASNKAKKFFTSIVPGKEYLDDKRQEESLDDLINIESNA